ncbi:SPAG4 protein, partial [Anseranas semipalmata]|nr:SPAG4 protein [Anseranas semipalmata]
AAFASGCVGGGAGPVTSLPLSAVALCFQPDASPGYCWPFQGSRGQVVIRLPAQIQATMVTIHHASEAGFVFGTVSSAPQDFTVSGVDEGSEEQTLLGTFTYTVEKEPTQTFPLENKTPSAFRYMKLVIQSNWGKTGYTCIYRVQVHGKIMGTNSVGQEHL